MKYPLRHCILALAIVTGWSGSLFAYGKIRSYHFGENDPGAKVGGVILSTSDSQSSPTYGGEFTDGPNFDPPALPSGEEFISLDASSNDVAPTYAKGRLTGLSAAFDGGQYLEATPFDPRPNSKGTWTEIDGGDFSFTTLSQAWIKPSSSGLGTRQVVWMVGPENGGVAITADGQWEIMHPHGVLTTTSVEFDTWHHVTMRRGGNSAILYLDGVVIGQTSGTWGGLGTLTVGAGVGGVDPYVGQIDDFNLATYRGPGTLFDEAKDIDFFTDLKLSDVRGDVDQDGKVNQADYNIWSANAGYDNQFGFGDPSTLLLGDVDNNGRINYFDFQIISEEAAAGGNPLVNVPEPCGVGLLIVGAALLLPARRRHR